MKLSYRLTEEARRAAFVATGRDPGAWQNLELDPAELSVEDRRFLLELDPRMSGSISLTIPIWGAAIGADTLYLDEPPGSAAALLDIYRTARNVAIDAYEAKREQALDEQLARYDGWAIAQKPDLSHTRFKGSPRYAEIEQARERAVERAAEIEAQGRAERRESEARQEAERELRIAERKAWAQQHGSPRLRKCVDMDYDCQRLYTFERAALEHPGYTLDYEDRATWKERSGPSEAALDDAKRVGGEIVWLTSMPGGDDYFEPCEAVVIRKFLGKYDLIKSM